MNYGNVILDFKKKNFYFEAIDSIVLSKDVPKFSPTILENKFIIGLVWDENLSEQIKFGDEIISVDNLKISEMKVCEILKLSKHLKTKNLYTIEIKNNEGLTNKFTIEK